MCTGWLLHGITSKQRRGVEAGAPTVLHVWWGISHHVVGCKPDPTSMAVTNT